MFGDGDGGIFENIASHFLSAFFDDKATKTTQVDILLFNQRAFDALHKSLDNILDEDFLNAGIFGDFVYRKLCFSVVC